MENRLVNGKTSHTRFLAKLASMVAVSFGMKKEEKSRLTGGEALRGSVLIPRVKTLPTSGFNGTIVARKGELLINMEGKWKKIAGLVC